jgi:uncharacterized protein (DUF58 family)
VTTRHTSLARTEAIPADILAHIRRIEIRARRLVSNVFLGEYHSVFKGRGIEFSEVRQYEPGDDVRLIEWNVTARLGAPYVKQYIEERELTVLLAVDISASSLFTTTAVSKRGLAAEAAALLAFAAIANADRVGLLLFTDRVERYVPPGKTRRHVLRLVRELLYTEPEGKGTDIGAALTYLARTARRRSIVFLISDFFDEGFEQQLRAASLRHEVIALTLTDPRDETMPNVGLLEVADPESGQRLLLDTNDRRVREQYARRAEEAASRRSRMLASAGVDEIRLRTDAPYMPALLRAFRARERRRNRR